MSKQQSKRKITVESGAKAPEAARPSVFERLGTKKAAVKKTGEREHCRQWAAHGVCAYGKGCKFAATHTLVSPSKARAAGKEDGGGARLHSTVVRADELDTWDQSDLEYADTDVLEKRRQQLQRELELQMKMDSSKIDRSKVKKKPVSSSSSSPSSSSSSVSSSSSGGSSSSSSSARDRKRGKKGKLKRAHSSSSSDDETPSKKKKKDSLRVKAVTGKKVLAKKDDRKKRDSSASKKKILLKLTLGTKKSVSPGKKASGTPPIGKVVTKNYRKQSKSPARKEKNQSPSRDKDRRERDKDKERDRRAKSRSITRKGRSRSPLKSRERRKDSPDRSRPISPKKSRRDGSIDKHRKSPTRDRDRRDNKDRSLDRRKDDKDRHDRDKQTTRARDRDRGKDKRDTLKRGRDRREPDRGLEKPSKPMERLLPRPEERMAALAAITNRNLEPDKSIASKDRQESERGRKQDRLDRDRRERSSKRDRTLERDHGDYERGIDRGYNRSRSIERSYDRGERYEDLPRDEDNRSPGYGRERHYDPPYDIPGHPRYPEDDDRYGDRDHREIGFDERRRREHSWEGSVERERQYHPHKEWEGEEFRGGDWGRERHWQHREQMGEWVDKEGDMEGGWHHRGHPPPGPHRPRHDGYNRRMDPREPNKRRSGPLRPEAAPSPGIKPEPSAPPAGGEPIDKPQEAEDLPIPDDLSEISDDPDDILNRDDMMEKSDSESQAEIARSEDRAKSEAAVAPTSTQECRDGSSPKASKSEHGDGREDQNEKLDFEDVSEGDLEEERARAGLGDALGVDWASLVAEVRRGKARETSAGAQARWRPHVALAALGIHVQSSDTEMKSEDGEPKKPIHPVPSIQVAIDRRMRQRAALFGSGCDVMRALSARRDLALRRHLCYLPPTERGAIGRTNSQPQLFQAAKAMLMQGAA